MPALCQFTLSHICGILTSESANVSGFNPHIIFAVSWHRIWDLTVGMIHKIFDFMTCVVIRSLCFFNNMWKRLEY